MSEPQVTIPSIAEEDLTNTDFIVVVDISGSMAYPSTRFPGRNRLQEVQEDVVAVASLAEKFDSDGITTVFFSSGVEVHDNVTSVTVAETFAKVSPRGSTNLAVAIEAVHAKAAMSLKEVVAFIYTDGSPDSIQAAEQALVKAGRELGDTKIGFTFIQVGTDAGASAFLHHLDNDLTVDIVATVSAAEAEKLSVAQLAWLARNG
jgi:Mg-chelatase subunit ChlD